MSRQTAGTADGASRALLAAICIAGPALVALIPMAAAPAMPAMAARFASSGDGQLFAQMVMTAPAIMLIVAAPIAGMLAARFGRRVVLLVSLLLYVLGGAGVLLIDDSTSLIALRLLLGVAGGGLLTSSLALVGEHFEGEGREQVLGYATSASSLVAAAALMFGGALVDGFGWRAPFALYLFGLPVLLAAWIVIRPAGAIRPDLSDEAGHLKYLGRAAPLYLLLILLTIGMFTPAVQVPFVLEARGIASAAIQGTMIAATSLVAMVSAGLYGTFRRWLSVQALLAIDALSMGAGILMIGIASSPTMIVLGCALVGIGAGMSEPAIASAIFDRTPPWVHAVAMGLIVSALNVGLFVNPLVMAPLRASLGVSAAFLVLGGLLSVVAALLILRSQRTRHGAKAQPLQN